MTGSSTVAPISSLADRQNDDDQALDASLSRIAALFAPQRGLVLALVVSSILEGLSGVVSPFLLREILDRALPERSAALVVYFSVGMMIASLSNAALGVLSTWLANLMGQRVMHSLRVRVFDHLQRMSLGFYTRTQAGEVQSRLANDVGGVDSVVTTTANAVVANVVAGLAVAIAALVLNWRLAVISLIVVPAFIGFSLKLARQRRRLSRGRQRHLANLTNQIEQVLSVSGILLTKTMGREQYLTDRFERTSAKLSEVEMASAMSGRWTRSTRKASLTMIPAITYLIAGLAVANGATILSIGTVVAFTSLLNRLVGPATALQGIGATLSSSRALFGRVFEVLDLPIEVAENPDPVTLTDVRGEIVADEVTFSYPGASEPAVRGVSFVIEPGTTTAVVGRTGSGKTTLAYLIARLYDVSSGAVSIDGHDLRRLSAQSRSDAIGLVAQDSFMFHRSIAENLRFAAPGATFEQLRDAARASQIDDLIMSLPDGYDTVVGAGGHRFSGGERQRLAIARMLLRNPAILLLDEATSALDTETERSVSLALQELSRGCTTIAIAHRLSTVRRADQILVLENGRIIERGTHEELLARRGQYSAFAEAFLDSDPT